jgi:predicted dehydrogenase
MITAMNRRQFIKTSSAAAVLSTVPWVTRADTSPNAIINIALIGTGDRMQMAHIPDILNLSAKHNVRITAVCDVWKKNRESAAAKIKQKSGAEPRQFSRFQEVLQLSDIDAVIIATPDFSHGPILCAALEANKDVYIEKPMCIDVPSANKALDIARAKNRIVQAGTQRRSDGHFVEARKQLQTGVLGQLNRISAAMCVNSARWSRAYEDCQQADVDWDAYIACSQSKLPFDAKLLRRWQLYRLCSNGMPGLWMTHYSDSVHMLTGAKYPASAVALGGRYVWKDGREHADTFHALLDYPEGFLLSWGMGLANSAGIHYTLHGTKGTLDAEKWTITSDGHQKFDAKPVAAAKVASHMENWLECLRSREKPTADIEYGHQHTVATVMAATAFETGLRQKYDPAKREIYAG